MIREVLNAIFLTYVGTEYLTLSNRDTQRQAASENHVWKVLSSKATLIAACVVGAVNIMSHYEMVFWSRAKIMVQDMLSSYLVISFMEASFLVGAIVGCGHGFIRLYHTRYGCGNDQNDTFASIKLRRLVPMWILAWMALYIQSMYSSASLSQFRMIHVPRILFAVVGFALSLYADCKRALPSLSFVGFLRRLMIGFLRVAPVYPFLVALLSFAFLFLVSIFETLNIPTNYLNMPIYYGCLYGPLAAVYWSVKSRLVTEKDDYNCSLPTTQQQVLRAASYEAAIGRAAALRQNS